MNTKMRHTPALVGFSLLLVFAMGMPMLIFYAIGILGPELIADLGIPKQQLGWLTTSTFGLAAVLSPWAGTAVQRIGTRGSLICLFLLVGLSFLLMAVLPGFTGLVIALLFCGIAQSFANPATNQAIAQCVPPSVKAGIVGIKQSGVQVFALLAGLVVPSVALLWGWRGALAIWMPLALLMAVVVIFFVARPTQVTPSRSWKIPPLNKGLSILMAIQLCAGLTLSSFMTYLGVWSGQFHVSAQTIGAMVSCFGVMGILSRVFLTPLGAKLKDETVLLGSLFVLAIAALAVMQYASTLHHWPLWVGVIGMGLTLVSTNAIAMSMLLSDPQFGQPAPSAAMLSVGFFGGFTFGPPSFGWILTHGHGFSAAWLLLMIILLCGCLLCLWLSQHCRHMYHTQIASALDNHHVPHS
ncbi:MAG: hypothetical protein CENE_00727 [Candidatus Celerinatantimonas neptuna]|nr:MAG: hypothetical protein CENE_00727 [Candidatus Celerinatantimonas neptuna]